MSTPTRWIRDIVMAWKVVSIALGLAMTALTLARLRRPAKANALKVPDLTVGDRLLSLFVIVAFTLAFVNLLILIAAKTLQ